MRTHSWRLTLPFLVATLSLTTACRTYGDSHEIAIPEPLPGATKLSGESPDAPLLQKVVGDLTKEYPENRQEVCSLLKTDVDDLPKVQDAITTIKAQEIVDSFILTAVIPSIQYFGYLGTEQVLLSEISDKKRRTRLPVSEQGNPSLDYLMGILDAKCGVKDARP